MVLREIILCTGEGYSFHPSLHNRLCVLLQPYRVRRAGGQYLLLVSSLISVVYTTCFRHPTLHCEHARDAVI